MALTFPRWLALALAGFAIVPLIVLRDRDQREWQYERRDILNARASRAISRAGGAAERLRLLQLHDSVRQALRRSATTTGRVFIDPSFDSRTRVAVNVFVKRGTTGRPAAPKVTADVVVVQDTVQDVRGAKRWGFPGALTLDYLLPRHATNDHCVVVARVDSRIGRDRNQIDAELTSDVASQRLMGPCAFYEAFGHPGARIDEWLRGRGWALGQASKSRGEPFIWVPPHWYRDYFGQLPLDELMAKRGVACASGDDAKCLEGLLASERFARPRIVFKDVAITRDYNPFTQGNSLWYSSSLAFGPMEWTMLADMVRTVGPERFAGFWSSDRLPADAFEQATGQPLARWTRDWITRMYHEPGGGGPTITAASAGSGLLLLVLGVAVSIRAARRRQTS